MPSNVISLPPKRTNTADVPGLLVAIVGDELRAAFDVIAVQVRRAGGLEVVFDVDVFTVEGQVRALGVGVMVDVQAADLPIVEALIQGHLHAIDEELDRLVADGRAVEEQGGPSDAFAVDPGIQVAGDLLVRQLEQVGDRLPGRGSRRSRWRSWCLRSIGL